MKFKLGEDKEIELKPGDRITRKGDVSEITEIIKKPQNWETWRDSITKIERPTYSTIYKKEILDNTEKKWLKNFIKSTKLEIEIISKIRDGKDYINKEKICLRYKIYDSENLEYYDGTFLPPFKAGTMYKGMKLGEDYTLKQLGLED